MGKRKVQDLPDVGGSIYVSSRLPGQIYALDSYGGHEPLEIRVKYLKVALSISALAMEIAADNHVKWVKEGDLEGWSSPGQEYLRAFYVACYQEQELREIFDKLGVCVVVGENYG